MRRAVNWPIMRKDFGRCIGFVWDVFIRHVL